MKKRVLSLALALLLCLAALPAAWAAEAPQNPFPDAEALYAVPVLPAEGAEAMIYDLFQKILDNHLLVDANSPANKDEFRMVLQHMDGWGLYGPESDGGGYADYSHITTSESQGYGMLMLAYLAGSEEVLTEAGHEWIYGSESLQDYYNAMLRTVQAFPSVIGPNLFCWELFGLQTGTKEDENALREGYELVDGVKTAPFTRPESGGDSAIDGDMDIIYSLLLADRQWGSDGAYNYREIALAMLADLWTYCVHPEYKTLMLGDWASETDDLSLKNATRASDFIFDHLKVFAVADPEHDWNAVVEATYGVIGDIRFAQNAAGNQNGFLPDFIVRDAADSKWVVPTGYVLEDEGLDGGFGYNSVRIPWRLGTDYLLFGDTKIGDGSLYSYIIGPLDEFAQGLSDFGGANDISQFGPFNIDGSSYGYTEPALFAAPFLVTAAGAQADPAWVDLFYQGWSEWYDSGEVDDAGEAIWLERQSGIVYNGDTYSDYIKTLVLIAASGHWWLPEEVARGEAYDGPTANPSSSQVFVDGQPVELDAFNIEGSNYIKLRDLLEALDISVSYDLVTKNVTIDTTKGYTP